MTMHFRRLIFTTSAAVALLIATGLGPDARTLAAVQIEIIALTGDQAPGTEAGVVFLAFPVPMDRETIRLNDLGQVAFPATLAGNGVDYYLHTARDRV